APQIVKQPSVIAPVLCGPGWPSSLSPPSRGQALPSRPGSPFAEGDGAPVGATSSIAAVSGSEPPATEARADRRAIGGVALRFWPQHRLQAALRGTWASGYDPRGWVRPVPVQRKLLAERS